jgi:hypothetical protein
MGGMSVMGGMGGMSGMSGDKDKAWTPPAK